MEMQDMVVKNNNGEIIPTESIWMIQFRNDEGPKIRVKLFGLCEDLWDDTCTIEYLQPHPLYYFPIHNLGNSN